jgi:hypothetical protein
MASGDYEDVIKALVRSGMNERDVNELVDIVAKFGSIGRRPKVFPKGQFAPDGIYLHTVLERDGLQELTKILGTSIRIDSVEVFPRGIINPDIFSARIGVR